MHPLPAEFPLTRSSLVFWALPKALPDDLGWKICLNLFPDDLLGIPEIAARSLQQVDAAGKISRGDLHR